MAMIARQLPLAHTAAQFAVAVAEIGFVAADGG